MNFSTGDAVLARKNAGEECFRHDCGMPKPRHPVTWICPAGHRETLWYCDLHGPAHMAAAIEAAGEGDGLMCQRCTPCSLMVPAFWGA